METLEAIFTRRSIRHFTAQAVDEEMITTLVKAGMYAPSAWNGQPWHFIVIQERSTLIAIAEIHQYAQMCREAALAIVVCGQETLGKNAGRWMLDCAAATENILLAAVSLGLGAVWVGIYPESFRMEQVSRLLGLPDGVHPVALIPVGWPVEPARKEERFKPERIHNEHW